MMSQLRGENEMSDRAQTPHTDMLRSWHLMTSTSSKNFQMHQQRKRKTTPWRLTFQVLLVFQREKVQGKGARSSLINEALSRLLW